MRQFSILIYEKKKGRRVKQMSATRVLTEEVLEEFARMDKENKFFQQQFQNACLNVFGTTLTSLQTSLKDNIFLEIDNCYNKQCPWKADRGLIVQGFFG